MSFADTYLKRYATKRVEILPDPSPDLFYSVIIPVFSEPDLVNSLESLCRAEPPARSWEILLVLNEPLNCRQVDREQNLKTIREIEDFRENLERKDLQIHILRPQPFTPKKAGPGLARKIGMDEAIRRFNELLRPDGVIISFDADTTCASNYFRELDSLYSAVPSAGGCTVYFEHLLDHRDIKNTKHKEAIIQYELYLRYFKMSLDWIGFPYSAYSLGSAFTVRADRYVKAGGMGLQQSGEDFYFLQKCIPLGNFWELNATAVYPSPRISDRVLFGTGPFLAKYLSGQNKEHYVYPFEILDSLKPIFTWVNKLADFPESTDELLQIVKRYPSSVKNLMLKLGWIEKFERAHRESANVDSFRKRFFHGINLLLVIRLFNELAEKEYPRKAVSDQIMQLLDETDYTEGSKNPEDLLKYVRKTNRKPGKRIIGIKSG